jgi:hypothetical protein
MQAPVPLHSASPHSLAGSVLEANAVQVPSAEAPDAAAHAWHVPAHALSQQTPSAQKPVPHWLAAVQGLATASFWEQVPPLQ